jgi:hypothetical protein
MLTSGYKISGSENVFPKDVKRTNIHQISVKILIQQKNGNTADSTENMVESSVFQSRNFHIILHPMAFEILYASKVV